MNTKTFSSQPFLSRLATPLILAALMLTTACATSPKLRGDVAQTKEGEEAKTYTAEDILNEAEGFFGGAAEGLGDVITKAFEDYGEPTGFITGEEASGALVVGARYGRGTLTLKSGETKQIYWQGASIGIDAGGNANKTFILVYNLGQIDGIFRRYPGVEGSLYFVGGVGVHYLQSDPVILAPIRAGVGWRAGASVGTMKITEEETLNPF